MNLMTVFFLQTSGAAPGMGAGGGSMMWIMLIAMFVIMYFFMIRPQNKKQKEIAEELNVSVKTIESQITIAYKKLREELKNSFPLLLFLLPF